MRSSDVQPVDPNRAHQRGNRSCFSHRQRPRHDYRHCRDVEPNRREFGHRQRGSTGRRSKSGDLKCHLGGAQRRGQHQVNGTSNLARDDFKRRESDLYGAATIGSATTLNAGSSVAFISTVTGSTFAFNVTAGTSIAAGTLMNVGQCTDRGHDDRRFHHRHFAAQNTSPRARTAQCSHRLQNAPLVLTGAASTRQLSGPVTLPIFRSSIRRPTSSTTAARSPAQRWSRSTRAAA